MLDDVVELPSVTSIIKDLTGEGWGPGSYRGFKLGIRSQHPRMSDERIEELYVKAKRGPWDPNKQLALAADRGTKAHEFAEMRARGFVKHKGLWLRADNEELDGYSRGAMKFFDENFDVGVVNPDRIIAAEKLVVSLKLGYAGTVDLIYREDLGDDSFSNILDFKTHKPNKTKGMSGSYYTDQVQVSMYMYAWEEMQDRVRNWDDRTYPYSGKVVTLLEDGDYMIAPVRRDWKLAETIMKMYHEKYYDGGL